jgi:peptidyl-prolyl cis-trans isomerase C
MASFLSKVTVNGEIISAEAIADEAQNHPAPKSKPGLAWTAAARALAIRALLLQEARRRGLVPDPQEVSEGKIETLDEALVRQVVDLAIEPDVPTDAEVLAAYEEAPDRWRAPTLYEAAHILLPVRPDDPVGLTTAQAQAEALLVEIRRNPRAFDALARENSACSSRDAGGRLGQLISGDTVPEFEAAMDALAEGAISELPILSRYGLHIIRLDARAEGAVLPFEAVASSVREMLEKAAWANAARDFVAELVAGADVTGVKLKAA